MLVSDKRVQRWCAYSAYVFAILFLFGWVVLAGFVPPMSPADSAAQTAQFYQDNLLGIRLGMVISVFSSALLLPWGGAVCVQMLRLEGPRAPMTWAWIAAQGCVVIEFVYPCVFWLTAAFRPEDATRVQTFNDLGWLPFLGVVCTGMFQMVALAVLTLRDPRPTPVFPRWFAFFQLWCAAGVGFTAGVFIFKTGPLAWDGLLGFWVPVSFYFAWLIVTTHMTARAIQQDDDPVVHNVDELARRLAALELQLKQAAT